MLILIGSWVGSRKRSLYVPSLSCVTRCGLLTFLATSRHVLQRGRKNTSCKILQLDSSVLPFCEIHINVLYYISIWFPIGVFSFLFLQYIKIFVLTLPIE